MDVSRETLADLNAYESLVLKWNKRINLISRATEADFATRHIEDCLQVFEHRPPGTSWVDLGSGAGLPGLVVAIAAKGEKIPLEVTLIESDHRKAAFCRTVVQSLGLRAKVLPNRIEDSEPQMADIVSCRALAPLNVLLAYLQRHLAPHGTAILQKGANWEAEVAESLASWHFSVEKIDSRTDPAAAILKIGEIRRV